MTVLLYNAYELMVIVKLCHHSLFLGNFYDFDCVPNDRADDGYQYVSPSLTFPCDGVVTKWKMGVEKKQNELVYLQIWRPRGTDYSRVAEYMYSHGVSGDVAEVTTDMTVSAGDVIGFFIPRGGKEGLRVAWAPVPDHTLLQGMMRSAAGVSPVTSFSDSPSTLSSSPLVSVIFGKCTMIMWSYTCIWACHYMLYNA